MTQGCGVSPTNENRRNAGKLAEIAEGTIEILPKNENMLQ
jgi:hypothetical protein